MTVHRNQTNRPSHDHRPNYHQCQPHRSSIIRTPRKSKELSKMIGSSPTSVIGASFLEVYNVAPQMARYFGPAYWRATSVILFARCYSKIDRCNNNSNSKNASGGSQIPRDPLQIDANYAINIRVKSTGVPFGEIAAGTFLYCNRPIRTLGRLAKFKIGRRFPFSYRTNFILNHPVDICCIIYEPNYKSVTEIYTSKQKGHNIYT